MFDIVSCELTSAGVSAHADKTISPKNDVPMMFRNEDWVRLFLLYIVISISPNFSPPCT